jgi:hypothetical protein
MSNGDVKSHVTSVHLLDDDTVQVNVQFDGFTAGEDVEISGYVTQTRGARYSFHLYYLYTKAPEPTPGQTWVTVPVTIDEKIADLRPSDRLTTATKVAKVWPTVLAEKTADSSAPGPRPGDRIPVDPANPMGQTKVIKATWEAENY